MWLPYLGVIIIVPYLLSVETLYSQSMKNLLIIFRSFGMEIKYKEYRHIISC